MSLITRTGLLRNRDFVIALAGRGASMFGDEMAVIALTLRLQAGGAAAWQVALLLGAGMVPLVLLARVVGRTVDSVDSRRILVGAGALQLVCCAPLILVSGIVPIAALVAALGVGTAFSQAAWGALIPRIVGEDRIGPAISLQQATFTVSMLCAPAAGGLLMAGFGSRVPLIVDVASFAAVTVAAMVIRTRRRPRDGVRGSVRGSVRDKVRGRLGSVRPGPAPGSSDSARRGGVAGRTGSVAPEPGVGCPASATSGPSSGVSGASGRDGVVGRSGSVALGADPLLRFLVIGLAVFVLLAMMANVVSVYLIRSALHASAWWYGTLESTWGAGVVVSSLVAGRLHSSRAMVAAAAGGAALMSLTFIGYASAPGVTVLLPLSIAGGIGNGFLTACVSTLVVQRTDDGERGRVLASLGAVLNGASVLSLALGGVLAAVISSRGTFLVAGVLGSMTVVGGACAVVLRAPGDADGSAVLRAPRGADGAAVLRAPRGAHGAAVLRAPGGADGSAGRPAPEAPSR